MKGLYLLLNILLLAFMTACQVEEKSSSGGMVSGHLPSSNKFTILAPAAGNYVQGDEILFQLKFPYNVTVGGANPQLALIIGSTSRAAIFESGSGTSILTFKYTVQASDNDSDGVRVSALSTSGTLEFNIGDDIHSCNLSLTAKTFPNVRIDNQVATINSILITNVDGFYHLGEYLEFRVNFSEVVTVTDNPQFLFRGASPATDIAADYHSGSGTTSLYFRKTIEASMGDTNGLNYSANPIDLTNGDIRDSANNTHTYPTAAVSGFRPNVDFNGAAPYVINTLPPTPGTYPVNQNLDFVVEFNKAVNVADVPYIVLTVGATTRNAVYVSHTNQFVTFRYATIPGDVDTDGVEIANTITFPAGASITGAVGGGNFVVDARNNTLRLTGPSGIILNATQPQVMTVARNPDSTAAQWANPAGNDNIWIIGQTLDITLGFNAGMLVNQTNGVPRLALNFNGQTRYAIYLSGGDGQTSLTFRYTIVENDTTDATNVQVTALELNGGTITDTSLTNTLTSIPTGAQTLTNTRVYGIRPEVSSVAIPTTPNATYSSHIPMDITVVWSEAVRYSNAAITVPVTLDSGSRTATRFTNINTNTASVVHRYTPTVNVDTSVGVNLGSALSLSTYTVRNQAGNEAIGVNLNLPNTSFPSVNVDTTAASIIGITPPVADTYIIGDTLQIRVQFDEIINVNATNPFIPLTFTNGTRNATYVSGSGSDELTFEYTIVSGDYTSGNPSASSISNPTNIRDIALNRQASLSISPDFTDVIVDGVMPTVSSRIFPSNGTYSVGETLTFTLNYNDTVYVTGNPRIQIALDSDPMNPINLAYVTGDGTSTLEFSYTLQAADLDFTGLPTTISSISLNSGTIQDINENDASTSFTAVNLSNVFIVPSSLQAWASHSSPSNRVTGGSGITFGGSGTVGCGVKQCRRFDGTQNITSSVNNARVAYIVMRTAVDDSTPNFPFIGLHATLNHNGTNFTYTSGTSSSNHATLNENTRYILRIDFTPATNLSEIIETGFIGGIGEIMIFDQNVSGATQTAIETYLNTY